MCQSVYGLFGSGIAEIAPISINQSINQLMGPTVAVSLNCMQSTYWSNSSKRISRHCFSSKNLKNRNFCFLFSDFTFKFSFGLRRTKFCGIALSSKNRALLAWLKICGPKWPTWWSFVSATIHGASWSLTFSSGKWIKLILNHGNCSPTLVNQSINQSINCASLL